jgi:hypothetical protein
MKLTGLSAVLNGCRLISAVVGFQYDTADCHGHLDTTKLNLSVHSKLISKQQINFFIILCLFFLEFSANNKLIMLKAWAMKKFICRISQDSENINMAERKVEPAFNAKVSDSLRPYVQRKFHEYMLSV